MSIDNLFTDDLNNNTPLDLERAITTIATAGIEEKFRLDFKQLWDPDKLLPDVAAFANSYGGLLVIGVSDDRRSFPGTPGLKNSDLKTQISSQIANRISPVPIFEVHTCLAPGNPNHHLVVVRVAQQAKIHMYMKGDRPVYVRNEDGTIPARAAQLQALIDRVNAFNWQPVSDAPEPGISDFFVKRATSPGLSYLERKKSGNHTRSETTLLVRIVPDRPLNLEPDVTVEQHFKQVIYSVFPSIAQRRKVDLGTTIFENEDRRRSWFRYDYLDLARDHEFVCALDSRGAVQCLFEVADRLNSRSADRWSIPDAFTSMSGAVRLAHEMWSVQGFFGSGMLTARLQVSGLVPFLSNGEYAAMFYESDASIPEIAVRKTYGNYEVSVATAEAKLTYDARTSERRHLLAKVGNQLLRDLRFAVDTRLLYAALSDV